MLNTALSKMPYISHESRYTFLLYESLEVITDFEYGALGLSQVLTACRA